MQARIDFEAARLFQALDALPRHVAVEAPKAMRRSMLRLMQRIIAWTPPTSGRSPGVGPGALKTGEAAIRADIKKLVFIEQRAVLDFWLRENGGKSFVSNLTLNRKGSSERYTLSNIIIDPTGRELDSIHRHARNNRGRVPRRYHGTRVATTPAAFLSFVDRKKVHSGTAKSGWLPAISKLGGMSPAWIARHGMTNGRFIDQMTETLFTLEAVNSSKSIGSLAPRLITSSLAAEARAVERELSKAVESALYASKLSKRINAT